MNGGPPQPPAPPPVPPKVMDKLLATAKAVTWEEIASILRSDQRRGYKVDIETDGTNAMDSEVEKQQRIEFLTAMGAFMEKTLMGVREVPPLATLAKELATFAVGAFPVGRTLEEAFDDAFEQIEGMAKAAMAKGPPKDPEQQKLEAELQFRQADMAFKAKEAEQDRQVKQAEFAHSAKLKEMELQHSIKLEEFKAQNEARLAEMKLAQEQQFKQAEFQQQQAMAEYQANVDSQKFDRQSQLEEQKFTRSADLEERKIGQQAHVEQQKLGFERERHGQTMAFEQEKADREMVAQGQVPSPDGKPAGVAALVQTITDAAREVKEALSHMAALQMQIAEFQERARKGARLIRGQDGRATHVENGHGTYAIERGPDGRAMGLMQ